MNTSPRIPPRTYSQWDWSTMRYNYFTDPTAHADLGGYQQLRGINTENPGKDGGSVGNDIQSALRPLPKTARPAGSGLDARGELVRPITSGSKQPGGLANPVIGPVYEQMVEAQGGSSAHPGITIQSLDYPPIIVGVTTGLVAGFGLGRAFGSKARIAGWIFGTVLGLVAAGARREALIRQMKVAKK